MQESGGTRVLTGLRTQPVEKRSYDLGLLPTCPMMLLDQAALVLSAAVLSQEEALWDKASCSTGHAPSVVTMVVSVCRSIGSSITCPGLLAPGNNRSQMELEAGITAGKTWSVAWGDSPV